MAEEKKEFSLNLKVWRQAGPDEAGKFVEYTVDSVHPDMSFLEMLDVLNEQIQQNGEEPVEFDYDCREGICGSCDLMINGMAHGPTARTCSCEIYMRHFKPGSTVTIEPFRSRAFPVIK